MAASWRTIERLPIHDSREKMIEKTTKSDWDILESSALYHVPEWGDGFFSINAQGDVVVHPCGTAEIGIDLKKLVDELQERGIPLPILLRFTDILRGRDGVSYLAGFIPSGKLVNSPVPGRLVVLRSRHLRNWEEMDVDYRAYAHSAMFATPGQGDLWLATDTGMILKLADN